MSITYPPEMLPVADADEDAEVLAQCDCCAKMRPVSQCWTSCGLETFACDECRGITS